MAIKINGGFGKISSFNIVTAAATVITPPPPPPPAAILYNYQGGLTRTVTPTNTGSTYGYATALSGDSTYAALGSNSPRWVEVFKRDQDGFYGRTQNVRMELGNFGRQVTFSGDGSHLFVGANGSISVFKQNGNGDNFELFQVLTIPNPGNGTALGIRPILASHDGVTVVANDTYQTHVFKYTGIDYQRMTYYSNVDDSPTGSTKMSSDGTTFLTLQSGSVIAMQPDGNFSNDINIGMTIESYSMSGDGLTVTASGPAGSVIFDRTAKSSPIWNEVVRFSYFDPKGIGRCDSLNSNGTIFVTSSAGNNGGNGHVRVYRKESTGWVYHAVMSESGGFGFTNAIAENGSAIMIGAPNNGVGRAHILLGEQPI
ncbi:MAG: hypothetical protein EOP83_27715 [Verrucomicrobiaceae bacterium]|nr:MAG: hypothetical protein EOP83_27715 [Verrucomicrobiaceae bacterium]